MRLLALVLGAVAFGLWLNARDLRRTSEQDDPMSSVQPPDPVTTRPVVITLPNSLTVAEVGHIRGWLNDHPDVLTELYESHAISTQTGPLGPTA